MSEEQLRLAVPTTWTPSGDARVDGAVDLAEGVHELPLADQAAVFEDAHGRLQQALSDAAGS